MKKAILIISILVTGHLLFSQDCKWKVEEIDPFNEKTSLQSKKIGMAAWTSSLTLWLLKKDGQNYLKSGHLTGSLVMDAEIENATLSIKLANGELLELIPEDVSKLLIGSVTMFYMIPLSDNELKLLSESNPIAFKSSFNAIEETFEPKKRDATTFTEYASCLLNYE